MGTQTVRLSFAGPVHFGRGRLSDAAYTFEAATLFSALFIEALHAGTQEDLLEAARCGDLTLSDAFPYIGETFYLPKPMVAPGVFDKQNREREERGEKRGSRERKANKKLAYVPATRYGSYLAGTFDSIAEEDAFRIGTSYLQAKVNLTRAKSDDPEPYFVGGYSFKGDAGIYFMACGDYDLVPLLERLSYSGIGGKRTSGYGRFEFEVVESDPMVQAVRSIEDKARMGASVLLATSAPRQDELSDELLEGARYRLVRRGGFVQSATHSLTLQKKRDMYPFAAGFTFVRRFEGDVFDVNATAGAHPVFRYARALWMEV